MRARGLFFAARSILAWAGEYNLFEVKGSFADIRARNKTPNAQYH